MAIDAPIRSVRMSRDLIRLFIPFVSLALASPGTGVGEGEGKINGSGDSSITRTISINRIRMNLNDRGGLSNVSPYMWAYHLIQSGQNTVYNRIVFDQGPWIIGKVNGIVSAGIAHWGTSYTPGPVIDGKAALQVRPQDSSRYHPYRINSSTSPLDPDVVGWPSDLGAPTTPDGKPQLLGDELVWAVFNDADSSGRPVYSHGYSSFPHLPVEIQQSVFAAKGKTTDISLLANTLFIEWTFINKGTAVIESCYTALWTDIDFDDMEHNFPAVDTTAQVGYCWFGAPVPLENAPYAVGYVLLYGPTVPDPSSSAVFRGRDRAGYRNLPFSSYWGIIFENASPRYSFLSSPDSIEEAWYLARGFDREGNVIIDSVAKIPTRFPYSGDPITGTGWVYNLPLLKGEEGFMMFTGPFTMAPGDTQWMMTALVPALGADRFESIRLLRQAAGRLRGMPYDSIARIRPLTFTNLPQTSVLHQNYPNPFNSGTTIRYDLASLSDVSLTVYNILGQKVQTLVQKSQEVGFYEVKFDGSGLASGVYFYRLTAGSFVQTRKSLLVR
jgi:hypothetical protein